MIKASGATLRIKKIRQSRNGAFCVADLSTDFGEFKVKDAVLDQFDEGEYQATVWISEIFLAQYISYGKAVTEIRARLHELQVDSAGELDNSRSEPPEPDPIDEEARATKVAPVVPPPEAAAAKPKSSPLDALKAKLEGISGRKKPSTAEADKLQGSSDDAPSRLFGDQIWEQIQRRAPVKLDPTVDRGLLRRQAAEMHQLNYAFDHKEQNWNPQ